MKFCRSCTAFCKCLLFSICDISTSFIFVFRWPRTAMKSFTQAVYSMLLIYQQKLGQKMHFCRSCTAFCKCPLYSICDISIYFIFIFCSPRTAIKSLAGVAQSIILIYCKKLGSHMKFCRSCTAFCRCPLFSICDISISFIFVFRWPRTAMKSFTQAVYSMLLIYQQKLGQNMHFCRSYTAFCKCPLYLICDISIYLFFIFCSPCTAMKSLAGVAQSIILIYWKKLGSHMKFRRSCTAFCRCP